MEAYACFMVGARGSEERVLTLATSDVTTVSEQDDGLERSLSIVSYDSSVVVDPNVIPVANSNALP